MQKGFEDDVDESCDDDNNGLEALVVESVEPLFSLSLSIESLPEGAVEED